MAGYGKVWIKAHTVRFQQDDPIRTIKLRIRWTRFFLVSGHLRS